MRFRRLIQFLALLVFLPLPHNVQAQQIMPSLQGTDFWMNFLYNGNYIPECTLVIASEEGCTAHISNPRRNWDTTVVVPPDNFNSVLVPYTFTPLSTLSPILTVNDAWHVTTSAPALLYASNFGNGSQDLTAVMPTNTLRYSHITQTAGEDLENAQIAIVAPHDSTSIHISFNLPVLCENTLEGHSFDVGDTFDTTLMSGQTLYITSYAPSDPFSSTITGFSGSIVESSRPIAVFQGHRCACIPNSGFGACDHLFEQSIPTSYWGNEFIVIPTTGRSLYPAGMYNRALVGDMVKVTALDDSCIVTIGGQQAAVLNSRESYICYVSNHTPSPESYLNGDIDFFQADALPISTSSRASVFLYFGSSRFGGHPGDPASVMVPPLRQGVRHTFSNVYNSSRTSYHYINIITPTDNVSRITLDGNPLDTSFHPLSNGYSYARISSSPGIHTIDGGAGGRFLCSFYGIGLDEAYAYVASMALRSADYDVRADRHILCTDDTATIVITKPPDVSHFWLVDSVLTDANDTLRISFDSAGVHRVAVVVTEDFDTVWEIFTVLPAYHFVDFDTICPGHSIRWHDNTYTDSGTYVERHYTDRGCDSTFTLQLAIRDIPHAHVSLVTECSHYHYYLSTTLDGDTAGYTFLWHSTPPDSSLSSQGWDSVSISPPSLTAYTLTLDGTCHLDTTLMVTPIRWPHAAIEVRPELLSVEQPDLTAYDRSRNNEGRHWWVDAVPVGDDPILHYHADTQADSLLLTLVAYNQSCADTISRSIPFANAQIWLPNVFTPDQPSNNLFAPVLNDGEVEELFVYNRQGLLVYRSNAPAPAWNGTSLDGTPCPQGAYVVHLRYHTFRRPDRHPSLTATVTLLR